MYKYLLCIILGILVFILWNRYNGFSVGGPAECAVDRDLPLEYLNMMVGYVIDGDSFYNDSIGKCILKEWQRVGSNISDNLCLPYCNPTDSDCILYNRFIPYLGSCPFVQDKDNLDQNYRNSGFEKISELIDVNSIHLERYIEFMTQSYTWLDIEASETSPILSLENPVLSTPLGLRFEEYMLKRYLEILHSGYNVKKIMDGIFYINGKIYYFKCEVAYFVRVSHNLRNTSIDNPTTRSIISNTPFYNFFLRYPTELIKASMGSFPILHTDATDIEYQKTAEDEVSQTKDCDEEIGKSSIELLLYDTRRKYDYAHFGISTETNPLYDRDGNEVPMDTIANKETFNLWVLLYSNEGVETLGFIDVVDESSNNPNQVQESLHQSYGLGDPHYRSNVLSYPFGLQLNLNNIRTTKTGDASDPNLNLDKLYTYTMQNGDGFRFDTKSTPHTGFDPKVENGLRISTESRYVLFNEDYNLSTPDQNVLSYMSVDIDSFFAEQVDLVFGIHQSLPDDQKKQIFQGNFTNVMFREVMDRIPYDNYFTNRDDSIRVFMSK